MSTQGGLKHVATEPSHLETKRERRRGAAGRASVLRRAPSDSDCSGETASLSADSGDRVVRPAPPPVRTGKLRSRRRGSEWEVLEGLKDGQRFDRRPEVFNGYLHKKRKWPLKGWHKRFFVVDGGILVYARSPTDVARGRLHGSVDVGLSVISAKARRRRIDIDADEFIYHLRAKTPDVFRTWLNVLKTHRLYRQHLLTFGARESAPKIHAPLDDLPPTDNSSRTSESSLETSTSSSEDLSSSSKKFCMSDERKPNIQSPLSKMATYNFSSISNLTNSSIKNWLCKESAQDDFMPLSFESFNEITSNNVYQNHSLCSMNCMAKLFARQMGDVNSHSPPTGANTEQKIGTEFDSSSLQSTDNHKQSSFMYQCSINSPRPKVTANLLNRPLVTDCLNKRSLFFEKKTEPTTALFLFGRKRARNRQQSPTQSPMKKSKKSTNVVKYKNVLREPTLRRPLSKSMLLGKYKSKVSKQSGDDEHISIERDRVSNEVQVTIENKRSRENKSLQDVMSVSEYDEITEKLVMSIIGSLQGESQSKSRDVSRPVKQIVKELYDLKFNQTNVHPVKMLFRSLLEYWLKNTSAVNIQNATKNVKSIDAQSNKHFTKDEYLSSLCFSKIPKTTQCPCSDIDKESVSNKPSANKKKRKSDTESFEKERRIQELERILKNTVYICETACSNQSKEKDIMITRKLIDNLEKVSKKCDFDSSNSSTEYPKIQETINHLLSETSIPRGVAKEFLGAYLDVLLHDNSRSISSSPCTDTSKDSQEASPMCDVQTESVQKKISKSITTSDKKAVADNGGEDVENLNKEIPKEKPLVDPGQMYLKDILDKITTIFSKVNQSNPSVQKDINEKVNKPADTKIKTLVKDELGSVNEFPGKTLISENLEENSVVIDLTKYDLEHISMYSNPVAKGKMSITIKLKEKLQDNGESKPTNLNLKFSRDDENNTPNHLLSPDSNDAKHLHKLHVNPRISFKNPYLNFDSNNDNVMFKPHVSTSEITSKGYCRIMHESEHSLDFSLHGLNGSRTFEMHDDAQSCYILSAFKKSALSAFSNARKTCKDNNSASVSPNARSNRLPTRHSELDVSEKSNPRIVDEKFILLLLENLTLLSQSIPGLHKDISALYTKLKKKHERVVKNSTNVQGLGLLGKIYNEENEPTDDNETQVDGTVCPQTRSLFIKETAEAAKTTSRIKLPLVYVEKSTSTPLIIGEVRHVEVQTEKTKGVDYSNADVASFVNNASNILTKPVPVTSALTSSSTMDEVRTAEIAVSSPNWYEQICTRDCAISTAIKCILDKDETNRNFRLMGPDDMKRKKSKKDRRQSPKVRENLIHEIRLMSRSSKVSTQSQTEGRFRMMTDKRSLKPDFKIYQLYCTQKCFPTRSDSFIESSIAIRDKSDDLKTLYRCSSDPSYGSESGGPLENVSRELGQAQLSVQQLQRLLDALELQHQAHHDTDVSASPKIQLPDSSDHLLTLFRDMHFHSVKVQKQLEDLHRAKLSVLKLQSLLDARAKQRQSSFHGDLSHEDLVGQVNEDLDETRMQRIVEDLRLQMGADDLEYSDCSSQGCQKDLYVQHLWQEDVPIAGYQESRGLEERSPILPTIHEQTRSNLRSIPYQGNSVEQDTCQYGFGVSDQVQARRELQKLYCGQLTVSQRKKLLKTLKQERLAMDTNQVSLEGASPNVKKDRRKFGLRKKKSNSKCASVELAPHHIDPSNSHMALSALTAPPSPGGGASSVPNSAASLPIACAAARPQSLPGAEALGPAVGPASLSSLTPDQQLREDFTVLAKDLLTTLKGVVSTLVCERGRLRAAMETAESSATPGGVAALRTNLNSALQQNSELRTRLSRIHDASDLAEISSVNNTDPVTRPFPQSLSYSSSCVSASEFFDAEEHEDDLKPAEILAGDEAGVIELDGDSSSEAGSLSSEEGSASSDNSEGAMLSAEPQRSGNGLAVGWARRTRLPHPRPTPGGPSLWNLLYKNIGKDLSQISMPVTINEPLNMLQRLCEELEYSELLDSASECRSGVERMALVAAFAVSAYAASAHRAASKPFNPLLAETYECVRDDRSFRFIAEQVSHHPPISACHAESPRWCFWQEARIKTKFWGKSMEFQPTGRVHVRLLATGDHYSWNKVTTCVHNLFGGQRWVDQYGDMHIVCHGTDITCKLNFIKASSWSSSRHEVRGAVSEGGSGARLRLHGRWSEALYAGEPPAARCLWRPGAMPPEHELYYGFTRFAMELNEMEPGMRELLPNTDTRLRPDQRALEEGDVEAAEQHKHALEQAQRERRRGSPDHAPSWFRKTVECGEETWVFTGEYWRAREEGFANHAPAIW